MNSKLVCDQCQSIQISDKAKSRIAKFTKQFESLFDVQPDLTDNGIKQGRCIRSFGLGVIQRVKDENEEVAVDALLGKISNAVQAAFGGSKTGRKLWWRCRPELFSQYEPYDRSIKRALWFDVDIEGITQTELRLLPEIPESVAVTFEFLR